MAHLEGRETPKLLFEGSATHLELVLLIKSRSHQRSVFFIMVSVMFVCCFFLRKNLENLITFKIDFSRFDF